MARCEWDGLTKGSKCVNCGFVLRRDFTKPPVRYCEKKQAECSYFLGATDPKAEVTIYGCGCASSKTEGITVEVCECALDAHPRCITFSRGTLPEGSPIMRCHECPDRQGVA